MGRKSGLYRLTKITCADLGYQIRARDRAPMGTLTAVVKGGVREHGRADGLGGGTERSVMDFSAVVRDGDRSDAAAIESDFAGDVGWAVARPR